MSSASSQAAGELAIPSPPEPPHRPQGRAWKLATGAAVLVAAAAVVAVIVDPFQGSQAPAAHGGGPTSLSRVTQRSLTSQTQVNATLGYAGNYSVVVPGSGSSASGSSGSGSPSSGASSSGASSSGTSSSGTSSSGTSSQGGADAARMFTALPAVGKVVRQGHSLYSLNGSPVVLLYGAIPAYRTLSRGMKGTDVQNLNADLVALGYATRSALDPHSSRFSAATATALKKLQSKLGVPKTGSLELGTAVFLPTQARVTSVSATLSAPAQPGTPVLQATSSQRQVTAQLDATLQPDVKSGDAVTITLPSSQTTPGVVTSVGSVATSPSGSGSGSGSSSSGSSSSGSSGTSATIQVDIKPTDPAVTGTLTSAPVQVTITTAAVKNALVVPVDALLARADGSYAVEVAGPGGRRLVPVSLGLFDDADGLVQVTGSHLSAGQEVVVPKI